MRKIITAAALAAAVLFSGCASSYPENEQEYLDFVKSNVTGSDRDLLNRGYAKCKLLDTGIWPTPSQGEETVIFGAARRYLCPEYGY